MLKKTFISSMFFLSTSSTVFASATSYVGGSLGIPAYHQRFGFYGATATVFGGKGWLLGANEKWYLGGEASANVGIRPNSVGVGASIIPGVMLTKSTMLYSRLGLITDYYPKANNIIQFSTVMGVGVQTSVAKHWDVRVEYDAFAAKQNQASLGLVYKFN